MPDSQPSSPPPRPPTTVSPWLFRAASLLPAVLVAVLYAQVRDHWYVEFDDFQYTHGNAMVVPGLTLEGFKWAFTGIHMSNYHPLTWLSYMLDFDIFGDDSGWFALENAGFHAINAVLVSCLFARLFHSRWTGIAVGCVFAVHPQLVEGVAWISQRKTVLATGLALVTILCHLRAVRDDASPPRRGWYAAALFAFALSLLAKGMFVTMPAMLLLLEQVTPDGRGGALWREPTWPRIRAAARRLLPYVLLALIFSAVTFWAQREGGAVQDLARLSVPQRIATALVGYLTYLKHFIYPANLSIFYPHPVNWHTGPVITAFVALTAVTAGLLAARRRIGCNALLGWLLFLGMMVPVIGVVQVGSQSSADRYMYGPVLGLLVLGAAIAQTLRQRLSKLMRRLLGGGLVVWLVFASVACYRQVALWRDSYVLTTASLQSVGPDPVLLSIQGAILVRIHEYDAAVAVCRQALQLWPEHPTALANLGLAEASRGNTAEGIRVTLLALEQQPHSVALRLNLALFYAQAGQPAEARPYLEQIRTSPLLTDTDRATIKRIDAMLGI